MAEPDLHTRLRSAIEERLALAQAAQSSNERLTLSWPRTAGKNALIAFFNADPIAFIIRACRADLARLERHRPIPAPTRLGYPGLVICAYEWQDGDGYIAIWSKDCPEVRSMAEVWLEVDL